MKIEENIIHILSNCTINNNILFLPPGQLDRKIYVKVNKVLEELGGKWNKKEKGHIFDESFEDKLDQIILYGEITISKNEYDFFPTPIDIVKKMLDEGECYSGMTMLEPNIGTGNIAIEAVMRGLIVDGYDINAKMLSNVIDKHGETTFRQLINQDFLTVDPTVLYDRIIMNPPFSKQQDIKHVNHALNFLKPNGILVSIMSAGVVFRQNSLTKNFRQLIESRQGKIEKLPVNSFKESKTLVNTVMIKM